MRWVWGCLLIALLGPLTSFAQRIDTLIPFTGHTWRFNDTGTDLGTAWRTNDFDDTGWSSGSGLFGVETSSPFPYLPVFSQITTPMLLGPPLNVSTTFYFRTWFNLDASNFVPGTVLVSTNFIDDGAVLYLNGNEVGRFRINTNSTAITYASGFNQIEGTNEVLFLDTNLFRIGTNLLAVEVHQIANNSSDVVWGHTLIALVPVPPVITNQPASQIKQLGQTAIFTVGVSGSPAYYIWQKESSPGSGVWGAPNPVGQNLPTYTIPGLTMNHAGNYRVIVTNVLGSVTSAVAQLTVYGDTTGPRPILAQPTTFGGFTNRVRVQFSELMNTVSVTAVSNYNITLIDTGDQVGIASVIYSSSNAIMNLNSANWHVEGTNHYVITINNVRDVSGNIIAPNSQVPVWWTNYVPTAKTWSLPPEPDPYLALTDLGTNRYRLSWTGHGYALESTTNLPPPAGLPVFLAWPEVTNMSNPFFFTNDSGRPQRYFRLRK